MFLHLKIQSHFILIGFKYYVLALINKYYILIVFRLYCKTLFLLLSQVSGVVAWVGLRVG